MTCTAMCSLSLGLYYLIRDGNETVSMDLLLCQQVITGKRVSQVFFIFTDISPAPRTGEIET